MKAKPKPNDDGKLFTQAIDIVKTENKASTSLLQRRLRIGYGRASRLIEELEEKGLIGAADGSRARTVTTRFTEDEVIKAVDRVLDLADDA